MARTKGSGDKAPRKKRGGESAKGAKTSEKKQASAATPKAEKKPAAREEPGIGHNLTDDQRRALLIPNLALIEGWQKQVASLTGKIRATRKELKSDGFAPYEVNYALALRKDKIDSDGKAETEKMRRMQRIALFVYHPIGTQPDLLDGVDRTPLADRAYEEGKLHGIESKGALKPDDHGYSPNTEAWDRYCSGWHDGRALIAQKGFKTLEEGAQSSLIPANRPDAAATTSNDDFGDAMEGTEDGETNTGDGFGLGAAAEGDKFLEEQRAKEAT